MSDRIRSLLSLPNVFTVLYIGYTMTNMRFEYCCVLLLMLCLCDCCDVLCFNVLFLAVYLCCFVLWHLWLSPPLLNCHCQINWLLLLLSRFQLYVSWYSYFLVGTQKSSRAEGVEHASQNFAKVFLDVLASLRSMLMPYNQRICVK